MSTIFITTSPKKHNRFSNSRYISFLVRLFTKDSKLVRLQGKKDYAKIKELCSNADNIVISSPTYVDALPSHLVDFLQESENESWRAKIYGVSCCGFYEGRQTRLLLEQLKLWCEKSNYQYGGSLGVGASEMLGTIRFTNLFLSLPLGLLVFALTYLFSNNAHSALISGIITFSITLFLYIIWSLGLFYNAFRFSRDINKSKSVKDRYTTLWFCPRFLFTLFANLFWIIRAFKNRVSIKSMKRRIKL